MWLAINLIDMTNFHNNPYFEILLSMYKRNIIGRARLGDQIDDEYLVIECGADKLEAVRTIFRRIAKRYNAPLRIKSLKRLPRNLSTV